MSEPTDPFELARAALDDAYLTEVAAGRTPEADDAISLLAAFRHELDEETNEVESPVVVPFRRRRIGRRIGVGVVSVVTALSATGVAAAVSGDHSDVLFPLHRAIFGTEGTSNTSDDTKTPSKNTTVKPSEPTEFEPSEDSSTQPTEGSHDGGSSSGEEPTTGASDGEATSGTSDGGSVTGTSDEGSNETPTATTSDGGGSDGSQSPSPSETPSSSDATKTSSPDGGTSTSTNTSTSGDSSATPTPSPSESTSK